MADDVKLLDTRNLKLPIRTMQYMLYPKEYKHDSGYDDKGDYYKEIVPILALKLHITAEVMETQFASFLFDCSYNIYVNKLSFGGDLVDFKFVDGSNSYLYITQKHYRITNYHLFSKDEIIDDFRSFPYLIEIGRNSHFL